MADDVTILLIDRDSRRRRALRAAMRQAGGWRLQQPPPGASLRQAITAIAPEMLFLGLHSGDARVLRDLGAQQGGLRCATVLFAEADPTLLAAAAEAGVIAWYPDIPPGLAGGLHLLHAIAARQHRQAAALAAAESRATERAVIEQAKRRLMQERRISEPEAYHWLRRRAMDSGRRMVELACLLLESEQLDNL